MNFANSERIEYRKKHGEPVADGVHIRAEGTHVTRYAVFDGREQVSDEVSAINDEHILHFIEGYSRAKRKYTEKE